MGGAFNLVQDAIGDAAAAVGDGASFLGVHHKDSAVRDGFGWTLLLGELVPGYKAHLAVRKSVDPSIQPTWTELMLWAVLVGEEPLARLLWAKTHEPIRAALMASKLCQTLAALPHLSSDQDYLQEQADEFEKLSIGLLDTIAESHDAVPLLTVCPTVFADPRF